MRMRMATVGCVMLQNRSPTLFLSCLSPSDNNNNNIFTITTKKKKRGTCGSRNSSLTLTLTRRSRKNESSGFVNENGVVEDMDSYLNQLSLEYDSVWDTKPSWCQPWTITVTGILVISCSWLILHSVVVTAVISFLICTWWYLFLYSYPKAYTDMIAERRNKVTSGVEDTYGVKRSD